MHHTLESEIVKFRGISISRKKWRKYIPSPIIDDYGYDVKGWLGFLDKLRGLMIDVLNNIPRDGKENLIIELDEDLKRLGRAIKSIVVNPSNWIVSFVEKEIGLQQQQEVTKVELKRLDISPYCADIFAKCDRTLMMSATILDKDAFCTNVGLAPEQVKFIYYTIDCKDFIIDKRHLSD